MNSNPVYHNKYSGLCKENFCLSLSHRPNQNLPPIHLGWVVYHTAFPAQFLFPFQYSHTVSLWPQFYSQNIDKFQLKQESPVWGTMNKKQSRSINVGRHWPCFCPTTREARSSILQSPSVPTQQIRVSLWAKKLLEGCRQPSLRVFHWLPFLWRVRMLESGILTASELTQSGFLSWPTPVAL